MLISEFFRIAVEGDTTDGRNIDRKWLEEMAASYSPDKYTALINVEHIRGYGPSSEFGSYGKVLNLKTEEFDIDGEKRLALLAQINPGSNLIALNEKGQKLFTSMEIQPNFANSDQAYLVGLAVTDSPASLGTELLQFSASAENNPLNPRKQSPDNLFSVATEVDLCFDEQAENSKGILQKVKDLFSKNSSQQNQQFSEVHQAVEAIAEEVALVQNGFASSNEKLKKYDALASKFDALSEQLNTATSEHAAFKKQIETTDFFKQRPSATGGDGSITTDC